MRFIPAVDFLFVQERRERDNVNEKKKKKNISHYKYPTRIDDGASNESIIQRDYVMLSLLFHILFQ